MRMRAPDPTSLLAVGPCRRGVGPIPPNSTLVFDVTYLGKR